MLDDWVELELKDWFTIAIPRLADYALDDEGRTLTIGLPTHPRNEILIGKFDYPPNMSSIPEFLAGCVRTFCEEIIPKVTGKPAGVRVHEAVSSTREIPIFQGIASQSGHFWLVRTVGVPDGYFLMHCNGPAEVIQKIVLTAFESFNPGV